MIWIMLVYSFYGLGSTVEASPTLFMTEQECIAQAVAMNADPLFKGGRIVRCERITFPKVTP